MRQPQVQPPLEEQRNPFDALPAFPAPLKALVARLPQFPPSAAAALLLNLLLGEALTNDRFDEIRGRVVRVEVSDVGLALTVRANEDGLTAMSASAADVTITSDSHALAALASGREDADTLFFNRRLVMSGDTELGLYVRNVLEGLDVQHAPLQLPTPRRLVRALTETFGLRGRRHVRHP
jgi:predicted lipid carrier protein YhbT